MDTLTSLGTDEVSRIIDGLNFMKFVQGKWSPKAWYLLYHTESTSGAPISVLRQRNSIQDEFQHTLVPGHCRLADLQEYIH